MRLVVDPGHSIAVAAQLSYGPHDPYAVQIVFHTGSHGPVPWVFSRELLAQGTLGPCGQGDVRIWPAGAGRRRVLYLELTSPDGRALLHAPAAVVERWLRRTHQLVPPGQEAQLIDVDGELCGLLGESA
ncbi:SsgA family sporulation/cell division regulator [Streptomyces macrosporus]|uniref:SsgA family sporulation/cell division regulator n=2 Tax=Streptomyces macrosporus TaxID=44032 RepID=A0ABP5XP73_9ACTN